MPSIHGTALWPTCRRQSPVGREDESIFPSTLRQGAALARSSRIGPDAGHIDGHFFERDGVSPQVRQISNFCLNRGPMFTFSPAISFFVNCVANSFQLGARGRRCDDFSGEFVGRRGRSRHRHAHRRAIERGRLAGDEGFGRSAPIPAVSATSGNLNPQVVRFPMAVLHRSK